MTGRMEEILFYPLLVLTYGSSASCIVAIIREEIMEYVTRRRRDREANNKWLCEDSLMLKVSVTCTVVFLVVTVLVAWIVGKVGVEGR